MKIEKSGRITGLEVDDAELEKINQLTLSPLTAEEVFAFRVIACGNDIDRDGEAFTRATLETLSEMYVGKTMITDHKWSANGQIARVYRTEVCDTETKSKTGEQGAQLIAYCYMVRTDRNQGIIAEIKAGIKKEVSIGCSISRVICSICGEDNTKTYCEHRSGKEYGGKICYRALENPKDAYEISFVAVPAQPEAGITKDYGGKKKDPPKQTLMKRLQEIFAVEE